MNQLTNLPFKSYTIMNNSLIAHFSCSDVYRLYVLSLTTDRDLKTDTTLDQLAAFVGEKPTAYKGGKSGEYKVQSFTERLKDSGEVGVETERRSSIDGKKSVQRNIYTFKVPVPSKYTRLTKGLFFLDLDIKVKGYIIKLFSITKQQTFLIDKSQREMEKLLKMSKNTIKKYNEILEKAGLLEVTKDGLLLKIDSLLIDAPNNDTKSKKMLEEFGDIVAYKQQNGYELNKQEIMYLKAKKDNFKGINNLEGWTYWLITGVPFKAKTLINDINIILS